MSPTPTIGRIPVRDVCPAVECGSRPAKAVVSEAFQVTAAVFREWHDAVGANVVLTDPEGRPGPWVPMREPDPSTDRWAAEVTPGSTIHPIAFDADMDGRPSTSPQIGGPPAP